MSEENTITMPPPPAESPGPGYTWDEDTWAFVPYPEPTTEGFNYTWQPGRWTPVWMEDDADDEGRVWVPGAYAPGTHVPTGRFEEGTYVPTGKFEEGTHVPPTHEAINTTSATPMTQAQVNAFLAISNNANSSNVPGYTMGGPPVTLHARGPGGNIQLAVQIGEQWFAVTRTEGPGTFDQNATIGNLSVTFNISGNQLIGGSGSTPVDIPGHYVPGAEIYDYVPGAEIYDYVPGAEIYDYVPGAEIYDYVPGAEIYDYVPGAEIYDYVPGAEIYDYVPGPYVPGHHRLGEFIWEWIPGTWVGEAIPVDPIDPPDDPIDPVDPPEDPIDPPEDPTDPTPEDTPEPEVAAAADPEPEPGPEIIPALIPGPDPTPPIEEFEIPDLAVPLAPPAADDYVPMVVIEDPAVPLAPPNMGEVAGFITTGLILAALTAAVIGNTIRRMRTEETAEDEGEGKA